MSNLVERLRGETDLGECGRLCDEAADEIARLTAEVKRLQAVVDAAMDWWHEEPGWSLRLAMACRALDGEEVKP